MEYRVITLSGEVSSGKSTIAALLLKSLPGWERVNTGQRFRDYARQAGISIEQVSSLPDEIDRRMDAFQAGLIRDGSRLIVEGRLSGWLGRDLPDVFRVFCHAPFEERARRTMHREGIPFEAAKVYVETRDRLDLEKFRRIYGIPDYRSPEYYNLTLNTWEVPPEALTRQILTLTGLVPAGSGSN